MQAALQMGTSNIGQSLISHRGLWNCGISPSQSTKPVVPGG